MSPRENVGELSHLGFALKKLVREIPVVVYEDN